MKRFVLPILISALAHGAFVGGVLLWSYLLLSDAGPPILGGGGGRGGLVAIELVDDGGEDGGDGDDYTGRRALTPDIPRRAVARRRNVRSAAPSKNGAPSRMAAPSRLRGAADISPVAQQGRNVRGLSAQSEGTGNSGIVSAGSGGGSGGGHGGGIGSGVGPGRGRGNPVLTQIWLKINRKTSGTEPEN